MANTTTYGNISDRALSIADAVDAGPTGSDFIDSSDMLVWINEALIELYALLVDSHQDYFTDTQNLSLVASTATYNLTTDPYRVLAVYYVEANGQRYMLKTIAHDRLHKLPTSANNRDLWWTIFGNSSNKVQLKFYPTPNASGTVEVIYVPEVTLFDGTVGTAIASAFPRGSEEYIVQDVAAKIMEKQEMDSRPFLMRRDRALEFINRFMDGRRPPQPNGFKPKGNFGTRDELRGRTYDSTLPPEF